MQGKICKVDVKFIFMVYNNGCNINYESDYNYKYINYKCFLYSVSSKQMEYIILCYMTI